MNNRKQSKYLAFTVKKNDELLPFIEKALNGISHTKAKAILANGGAMVNKNTITQYNYPLTPGMTVEISSQKHSGNIKSKFIRIVYEDHDIIIVEKNPGILSAPAPHHPFNVKSILDNHLKMSHQKCTSHVVHRLDRETSGLMVYSKNIETAKMLTENWQNIITDRRYIALVEGKMEQKQGSIESWLTENEDYITESSPVDNGGKYALTHFRTLRSNNKYSLVEFKLETGRKNQIRVHMQDMGHPVCGDMKYGSNTDPVHRLCLHAYMLCLFHPRTREKMCFETPAPDTFTKVFESPGTKQ